MEKVSKWFDDFQALNDVDLTIYEGERIVICGPSGSGKSTLIRCLNGLEQHQKGNITVHGTELTGDTASVRTVREDVGMVFQQFNLFPHLTVLENCTLAPVSNGKMASGTAHDKAMEYLKRVQIPEQADKLPGQLSGGQQQRVAIARITIRLHMLQARASQILQALDWCQDPWHACYSLNVSLL